jgi:hypothetical protein
VIDLFDPANVFVIFSGVALLLIIVGCLPTTLRVMRLRRLERTLGKAYRHFIREGSRHDR